eukprot:CAMPEP_0119107688 /NCGR_PEP_ID=MMETSP1180-20130426/11543_1 /TAXON_ID=3052 ORGANISM="Chlamydomonas cf sp, Strain CCMP681" /NCGR_SAMPLE_ID=MMETSP1180 /ASSEMBLY_ACC=CAM_ASM_000741 /LENGTH=152 /DNA_ID=CAMNT_0007093207 /DNA_START=33 /DNA_END=492 /DNA_ORIENTATION=+
MSDRKGGQRKGSVNAGLQQAPGTATPARRSTRKSVAEQQLQHAPSAAAEQPADSMQQGQAASAPAPSPTQPALSQSSRSEHIAQLRRRFQKPTTRQGKLSLFMRTIMFRADYLLGAYYCDWWETAIVYPVWLLLMVMVVYSAFAKSNMGGKV